MPEKGLLSPHQWIQYPTFGNNVSVPADQFHHWNLRLHKHNTILSEDKTNKKKKTVSIESKQQRTLAKIVNAADLKVKGHSDLLYKSHKAHQIAER
jgi:hypothetical protein